MVEYGNDRDLDLGKYFVLWIYGLKFYPFAVKYGSAS